MSNFTRSRRLIASNPIDIMWERQQQRDTDFIAAEEKGKAKELAVAAILKDFSFTPNEWNTLADATGEVSQLAMNIVKNDDVNMRFLVITKNSDGGGVEWSAYCPPFSQESGPLIIAAMQSRLESNRAGRAV